MPHKAAPVILPSETKAREFDAKLLLACELAMRGRRVFVGSRVAIHNAIGRFPRGIYLAKDFRPTSVKIFLILERLGHRILAWDEEALVTNSASDYLRRRLSPAAVALLDGLFAWGEANAEVMRSAPALAAKPINVTGNVRLDLARPEWRGFFAQEVDGLRERYGDFILINSSFGMVNHYLRSDAVGRSEATALIVKGGAAAPIREHRARLLAKFQETLPRLAQAFPDHAIVVRPHPSEGHASWQLAARGCGNVHVVHDGNVYAWLMAARVMMHNGCSTALEGFVLQRPVVAFRPLRSADHDLRLPNQLSRHAETVEELVEALGGALAGAWQWRPDAEQLALASRHMANFAGPAAGTGIADVLDRLPPAPPAHPGRRALGQVLAAWRASGKKRHAGTPGHKHSIAYTRHRFADTPLADVRERLARLAAVSPRFAHLAAQESAPNIFEIRALAPDKR